MRRRLSIVARLHRKARGRPRRRLRLYEYSKLFGRMLSQITIEPRVIEPPSRSRHSHVELVASSVLESPRPQFSGHLLMAA